MNTILINVFESALTMAVFYSLYRIFLVKETFFKMNRMYLLMTLFFSITVPFLSFNIDLFNNYFSADASMLNKVSEIRKGYNEINAVIIYAYSGKLTWALLKTYAGMIYWFGVFLSSVFFIVGLIRIVLLILRSKVKKTGKFRIVETNEAVVPFSLFKWIIINPEKLSSDDMEQIIAHEKIHAFQLHSFDLIFMEVLVILFWFNPFIYWYRKSIREVHEYLADRAVVENGYDQIDYQQLLFNQVSGDRLVGLTSRFSYSLSKNRLKMLSMMKSKNSSKIKIALAIPFAVVALFLFVNSTELVKASGIAEEEKYITPLQDTANVEVIDEKLEEEVYFTADVMPKFQGQDSQQFRVFIQENLTYPLEAKKKGIAGKVFVSFVVDKEGNVKKVRVIRGVDPLLDDEAIRVTKLSPKWEPALEDGKPVNMEFTIPIVFAKH